MCVCVCVWPWHKHLINNCSITLKIIALFNFLYFIYRFRYAFVNIICNVYLIYLHVFM